MSDDHVDLAKIAKLLGVAGSSVHDGEALNAIRACDCEIRKAGLGWADLVAPSRELAVADEANAALLAENIALRAELDAVSSGANGAVGAAGRANINAAAGWSDVGVGGVNVNATAQWAIDLHERHIVALTEREIGFLSTCKRWHGRLTEAQQDWFDDLIAKVTARSGQHPPL